MPTSLVPVYKSIRVSNADIYTFQRAIELSERGEHRVRVGTLLLKGSRPLGGSWNRARNPIDNVPFGDATVHAEQHVLKTNKSNVFGCTLYVARISVRGDLMASFPCYRCMDAIYSDGKVSKLVYFDGKALVKIRL